MLYETIMFISFTKSQLYKCICLSVCVSFTDMICSQSDLSISLSLGRIKKWSNKSKLLNYS